MKRLVVIGFGWGAPTLKGWLVSTQAWEYYSELGEGFDEVNIFVPKLPTESAFSRSLPDVKYRLFVFPNTWKGIIRNYYRAVRLSRGAHVLLFLPNVSRWFLIFPWLRLYSSVMVTYLADDPYSFMDRIRLGCIPGGKSIYQKGFEYILGKSDCIIARGRYLSSIAGRFNSQVALTFPMTPLPPLNEPRSVEDHSYGLNLVWMGRLVPGKGLHILIRAIAMLHSDNSIGPIRLRIAGMGPERLKLEVLVQELGIASVVSFIGYVDSDESRVEFWRTAHLHVFPSTESEGVPRAIDEAIYFGVPTIATRVGGIAREFEDGEVFLIQPGAQHELVEAIREFIQNHEFRDRLYLGMRQRANWLRSGQTAGRQHREIILGRPN